MSFCSLFLLENIPSTTQNSLYGNSDYKSKVIRKVLINSLENATNIFSVSLHFDSSLQFGYNAHLFSARLKTPMILFFQL